MWISVVAILLLSFLIALFSRAIFSFINNKFIGVLVAILLFISPPLLEYNVVWTSSPIEISDEYSKHLERQKVEVDLEYYIKNNKFSSGLSNSAKRAVNDYLNNMSEEEKDKMAAGMAGNELAYP